MCVCVCVQGGYEIVADHVHFLDLRSGWTLLPFEQDSHYDDSGVNGGDNHQTQDEKNTIQGFGADSKVTLFHFAAAVVMSMGGNGCILLLPLTEACRAVCRFFSKVFLFVGLSTAYSRESWLDLVRHGHAVGVRSCSPQPGEAGTQCLPQT